MNSTHSTLASNQTAPGMAERIGVSSGAAQPPKNMMVVSVDTKIMLAYSAMENTPNSMPEYSTWKPMISDSPSAMSNGARWTSATPEMKYTSSMGASGSQFQEKKFSPISAKWPFIWPLTMSERLRLCDTISTHTRAKPMAIS